MNAPVAVIGGGWAGLAAAVRLVQKGRAVTLLEMAPRLGGRARGIEHDGERLDNGQHILIGAYRETLAMMRAVGADPQALLNRQPLTLVHPGRHGLRLPTGAAAPAFVRGVLAQRDWSLRARLALLATAGGWALRRFHCPPEWTVARLCASMPPPLRRDLIDPLCVAALNTPADEASATVLLRVLRDGLFGGPGASDLLLPRVTLNRLFPDPAQAWLEARGATIRTGTRAGTLHRTGARWSIDGECFDAVVLSAPARESSRLVADLFPDWADAADGLQFEPIVTVHVDADGARLEAPMVALDADDHSAPAQFAFDLGALGGAPGRLALVVSGAAPWVARGREALEAAAVAQVRAAWPDRPWATRLRIRHVLIEKRATFRCTPALRRPPPCLAPTLWAAGDHVAGPYPATLEGAVRSGLAAADGIDAALADRLPLC